jgi:hypothetical protein
MSISKFVFLILLMATNFSFGKSKVIKKTVREPNQSEMTTAHFRVVYGDKTTIFDVSKSKNGGQVNFSNNFGAHETKKISMSDYKYLISKISSLSGVNNKKEFCMRNFIEIKTETREILGCLGAQNKFATDIQEIANLMSILF